MEARARLRLGFWEPAGYCQQSQLLEKKMKQNSGGCVIVLVGATSPEEGGQARPVRGAEEGFLFNGTSRRGGG